MSTPPTASLPGLVPQSSCAPEIDPTARLLFIINAASGRNDSDTTRQVIEETLKANGRTGELLFTRPDELARAAQQAAATACCAALASSSGRVNNSSPVLPFAFSVSSIT